MAEDGTRTGLPLLRPIFLEFPDATQDRHPLDIDLDASGEFMVGPDLLVAPPPFPDKIDDYSAKLPSRGWYDYWTGKPAGEGVASSVTPGLQPEAGKGTVLSAVKIHPELASLPVFVRPGTILPIAPLVESTMQLPQGPLTLRVFPGEHCAGSIYQDDGTSFAYRQGQYLRRSFSCDRSGPAGELHLHVNQREGSFPAWWNSLAFEVNGVAAKPGAVTVNGRPIASVYRDGQLTFEVPDRGDAMEVVVR